LVLAFFATIDVSAVFTFLVAVTELLPMQNAMGIGQATALELDSLMGLLSG
jgi:ESS family glutamate:Na+ symporter